MNCSICGSSNNGGSKFCIKCGAELSFNEMTNPNNNNNNMINNGVGVNIQNNWQGGGQQVSNNQSFNKEQVNFLQYVIGVLLKPYESFKKEETKLCDVQNSLILSGIVAGAMMLITLIIAMISVTFVKSLDYSTFDYKTSFEISNLKELDYLSLIGKNFLIFATIIAVIAGVYYLASLVVKKETNFIKNLSITSTSIMPFVILAMVASPILGKIWAPLSVVTAIAGIVYSITIFANLIKDEIKFDRQDYNIYFHLVCVTILGCSGYYALIKLITGSISNYLSLLK